jgi:2-polyprenyl-3-methyl-5-hydroxy-6-metoxy-1,4-benzoquinol methylase
MASEERRGGWFLAGGFDLGGGFQVELQAMIWAICSGTSGTVHIFREMMFGTRDEFVYWECSVCGCLQIVGVPEQLSEYYREDYYSFSLHLRPLEAWFCRAYFKAPRLARLIHRAATLQPVIDANPKSGARVLDVGCGGGKLVAVLRSMGFDAHGIDPFAIDEAPYVRRISLPEAENGWDLIMFHHSLEHMRDNVAVLRCPRQKLAPGGICLVRIPLAAWAWRHYGKHWVQIDAPRHLVIHTLESFRRASELAGFRVSQITFDSTAFQFYGSELYRRDVPLRSRTPARVRFSKATIRGFNTRASDLNRQQLGDQASFYLRAITP